MKYPDFIEELLLSKEYTALTGNEKLEVGEWIANEGEYNEIRKLLVGIENAFGQGGTEEAPAHIKANLEQIFAKKHNAKRLLVIRWQAVAIFSVAASLALLFYISTLFTPPQKPTEIAENLAKKEPLLTAAKPNTPTENGYEKTDANNKEIATIPPLPATKIENDTEPEALPKSISNIARGKKIELNRESAFFMKAEKGTTLVTQPVPQMSYSYSNPPAPTGVYDIKELINSSNYTVLSSVSLAENKDVLDLSVPVF